MTGFFKRIWINFRLWLNPGNVVIRGSCKMCGTCCKNLILVDKKKIIKTEEEFRLLKEKYPQYEIFRIKSTNSDGDLVFECTKLNDDNTCSIHNERPGVCSAYPVPAMFKHHGKLFKDCGYWAEPAVDFKEILNSK